MFGNNHKRISDLSCVSFQQEFTVFQPRLHFSDRNPKNVEALQLIGDRSINGKKLMLALGLSQARTMKLRLSHRSR